MTPTLRTMAFGLLLVVVGFLANFVASDALPPLPPCADATCTAAIDVALGSFLLIVLGLAVQFFALWRASSLPGPSELRGPTGLAPPPGPPGSREGFTGGLTPPSWPRSPSPPSAGAGPTANAPATTVRCDRCGASYVPGQFAYCPACGNPLPFAP